MDTVLDSVMCSRPEDEARFVAAIHAALAAGTAARHDAFIGGWAPCVWWWGAEKGGAHS